MACRRVYGGGRGRGGGGGGERAQVPWESRGVGGSESAGVAIGGVVPMGSCGSTLQAWHAPHLYSSGKQQRTQRLVVAVTDIHGRLHRHLA